METEKTEPRAVIAVDEVTARGMEVIKGLEEAFKNANEWIKEVYGGYYTCWKEGEQKALEIDKWYMGHLMFVIGDNLNITGFERI